MPKKILPRIESIAVGHKPHTLKIHWQHGGSNTVNLSDIIATFRLYAPLRRSAKLFQKVKIGEFGTDIVWSDKIDMSAETLWRLAQEQSHQTMTAASFRKWREAKDYTLDDVATALGISRRMVAYYEQGDKPIPRVIALATAGLERHGMF